MNISFVDRKYVRHVDSGFMLYDGKEVVTPQWNVGVEVFSGMHPIKDTGMVHIPCRVKYRCHSMAWRDVGKFMTLGTRVVLEAETGEWEDVLLWIVIGRKPEWAKE